MTETRKRGQEWWDLNKKFQLMALPAELRHRILSNLPEKDFVAVFLPGRYGQVPQGIEIPVIAQAGDRQLRAETIMVTIEQTTWSIHSGPGNTHFQQWLSGVDLTPASKNYTDGFDAVKSLTLPYFSRFPHARLLATAPNNDVELALKCKNLERLSTLWVDEELFKCDQDGHGPKTVPQLRGEYRLDGLLGLTKLKRMYLGYRGGAGGQQVIEALAVWFKADFVKRGKVEMVVTVNLVAV